MRRQLASIEFESKHEVRDMYSALIESQERMEKQGKKNTTKRQLADMLEILDMEW